MTEFEREIEEGLTRPERNEEGRYVCPECGKSFKVLSSLQRHERNAHGSGAAEDDGKTSKPKRGKGTRKERVKQSLLDLANLSDDLRGRATSDLPEHLADVIRRDADQIATVISTLAERVDPVKFFTDTVLPFLSPVVGASGVLRWLIRQARRRADARLLEEAQEYMPDPVYGGEEWREPLESDAA